jgi:hypothetical protein
VVAIGSLFQNGKLEKPRPRQSLQGGAASKPPYQAAGREPTFGATNLLEIKAARGSQCVSQRESFLPEYLASDYDDGNWFGGIAIVLNDDSREYVTSPREH